MTWKERSVPLLSNRGQRLVLRLCDNLHVEALSCKLRPGELGGGEKLFQAALFCH